MLQHTVHVTERKSGKNQGSKELRWRIDDREYSLSLGRHVSTREAEVAAGHVAHLIACSIESVPPAVKTQRWLDEAPRKLVNKLASKGLAEARGVSGKLTVGEFLANCIAAKQDAKPTTVEVYQRAVKSADSYFGTSNIRSITRDDAAGFKVWLETQGNLNGRGLAPTTATHRFRFVRECFTKAVQQRLISENPFHGHHGFSESNPDGFIYFPLESAQALISQARRPEFQLYVALCRIAGLRQTEPMNLSWADIDFDAGKMTVEATKTARHKRYRTIPIWADIRPLLERQRESSKSDRVISQRRWDYDAPDRGTRRTVGNNLTNELQREMRRLNLQWIAKPWNNMRKSGEIDATNTGKWKPHTIQRWWGHSERVQREFYLHPTDDDFLAATDRTGTPGGVRTDKFRSD